VRFGELFGVVYTRRTIFLETLRRFESVGNVDLRLALPVVAYDDLLDQKLGELAGALEGPLGVLLHLVQVPAEG
jgi:hypothetical protein